MRLLPASPRRRKRLLYASPFAVLAVVFFVLVVFFRDPGGAVGPSARPGKAEVYTLPKPTPIAAAAKADALRTLDVFVRSAALRQDLERSWELASPAMKLGTSHRDWLEGNLPVFPYPAAEFKTASYRVTGTYAGRIVDADALILPRRKNGEQRVYSCELHEVDGRWLVDWCYPRKSL